MLEKAWKCSLKSVDMLHTELSDELNETITVEEVRMEKRRKCNVLKMIVYVFCSLIERFEEQDARKSSAAELQQKTGPGGRGKKSNRPRDDSSNDWEKSRDKAIAILTKVSVMSLHRLFTPPVVEEEFVKTITKVCYKILESSTISKNTHLKNEIFQILANSVSRHKHSLGFCLKIIQLLQHKDHLVKDLASLIEMIINTHEYTAIIRELICEVDRVDMSRESAGTKAIAEFLKEVAERCPANMIQCIPTLMDFLDRDAYMIRSATLAIFGALISKELSAPDADVQKKTLRDDLLDKLEDHILDVTTFTRGMAIKVWHRLCSEGKIPIDRQESLIESIVGRLQDRSVYVRKQAVIFLTLFLKQNPFAAKLSIDKLETALAVESRKLKEMIENRETEQVDEAEDDRQGTSWEAHQSNLIDFWMNRSSQEKDEDSNESTQPFGSAEHLLSQIQNSINSGEYRETFKLIHSLRENFSDHPVLRQEGLEESEDHRVSQVAIPPPPAVLLAKKIYHLKIKNNGGYNFDNVNDMRKIERVAKGVVLQDLGEDEALDDNELNHSSRIDTLGAIPKQQLLVKYLSDSFKFAKQIQAAIPLVCSLLHSATVSDSQEAIDFFVTAHEFGVQGSIHGIRKMIVLVFSRGQVSQRCRHRCLQATLHQFRST